MDDRQHKGAALDRSRPRPGAEGEEADLKAEARRYKAHQKAITRGLRRFFDSVVAEPVPDEFMELLRRIDEGRQNQ